MSKKSKKKSDNNEEIDLLILFNYFGEKLNNLFNFIIKIIGSILSVFVYAAKAVLQNIKIISLVLLIAGVAGYFLDKSKSKRYESKMLVRTYFEAKYQLSTNIQYYNALLEDQDYEALSKIYDLDQDSIAQIILFEMSPGPETENERIKQYDRFVRSIDSVRAQEISFDDFIENRDIYSGNLFEIRVESSKKDIFESLETGINSSFVNLYSTKKMEKRDSMITIKKENILRTLKGIDSLKKVYINVIENESQAPQASLSLGDFPMKQEKSQTKEYQLLDKEIALNRELRQLDEQKIEENVFFDVISSFQRVGNEVGYFYERYIVLLPVLALLLLISAFSAMKIINFLKKYEA